MKIFLNSYSKKLQIVHLLTLASLIMPIPNLQAMTGDIERIDPPFWFSGMKNEQLDLLLYGEQLSTKQSSIHVEGCAQLLRIIACENENYLILQLNVGACTSGFSIGMGKGEMITYEMRPKPLANAMKYVDSADVMYLLMPDRFANGNIENDEINSMHQPGIDRSEPLERHGGDLSGVTQHLNYLQNLGITALWLNPVQENNQPEESYHGYAITDHYRIDPRLGQLSSYLELSEECRKRDIRLVMDVVYNHWGNKHRLYQHPPFRNWIHRHDTFFKTSYRATTLLDPYASEADRYQMLNGWFDRHMPDMNTDDSLLATYLIQNTLWWIATAQLGGLRIDTYAYPGEDFMEKLLHSVEEEFPGIFIFGETWVHGTGVQAHFVKGKANAHTALKSVTDFQLYYALNEAWNEAFSWTGGLNRIYYTLAQDYLYDHPNLLVTFLDNHDLNRFSAQNGDTDDRLHAALGVLLTTRGIPCIYYGTELAWRETGNHGLLRRDFPGGWPGDSLNAFEDLERGKMDNHSYLHLKKLIHLRTTEPAFTAGRLTQYVPENGVYTYFREYGNQRFMVAVNQNKEAVELNLKRFDKHLEGAHYLEDEMNGEKLLYQATLPVEAKSTVILRIIK